MAVANRFAWSWRLDNKQHLPLKPGTLVTALCPERSWSRVSCSSSLLQWPRVSGFLSRRRAIKSP